MQHLRRRVSTSQSLAAAANQPIHLLRFQPRLYFSYRRRKVQKRGSPRLALHLFLSRRTIVNILQHPPPDSASPLNCSPSRLGTASQSGNCLLGSFFCPLLSLTCCKCFHRWFLVVILWPPITINHDSCSASPPPLSTTKPSHDLSVRARDATRT